MHLTCNRDKRSLVLDLKASGPYGDKAAYDDSIQAATGVAMLQQVVAGEHERLMSEHRRPYRTRDGYIAILPYMNNHWRSFCELAGRGDLLEDEHFESLASPSAPEEWSDYYVWHADIFPFYPLPGREQNYTAGELFDFYVPKSGRFDDGPFETMNSWTRIGPWLPWMKMDGHQGLMVYHARARRLRSWDQLPEWVRERVMDNYPVYRHAPE